MGGVCTAVGSKSHSREAGTLLEKAHARKNLRCRGHLIVVHSGARRVRFLSPQQGAGAASGARSRSAGGSGCSPGARGCPRVDRRLSEPGRASRGAHAGGLQQDVLLHRQGTAARHHLRNGHGARKASQCQKQGSHAAHPRHFHSGGARPVVAGAGRRHWRHRDRRSHRHSRKTQERRFHRACRRQRQRDPGHRARCHTAHHRGRVIRSQRVRATFERLSRKPRGPECAAHRSWQEAGGYRRSGREPRG